MTGGLSRDDRFSIKTGGAIPESISPGIAAVSPGTTVPIELPETFWPAAFGLQPRRREMVFLHALMEPRPILCVLLAPDEGESSDWLQAAWEGTISWAFRSAQQFALRLNADNQLPDVQTGPASLLHTFLKLSVLDMNTPQLFQRPRCLNLITVRKDSDIPVDFDRLRAIWPGPVFRFDPETAGAATRDGQLSSDMKSIIHCLLLAAGCVPKNLDGLCPLKTLLWAREAHLQILSRASGRLGEMLAKETPPRFKGSNENSVALALKADVATWIKRTHKDAELKFEEHQVKDHDDFGNVQKVSRVDLFVQSLGRFEIESLCGSGPIEAFYHQKVFTRLAGPGSPIWLVVPNEAMLWAGPYLADIAYHLRDLGHVLLPGLDGCYLKLVGKPLDTALAGDLAPEEELRRLPVVAPTKPAAEPPIRLEDVAGYTDVRNRIWTVIVWPEKNRHLIRKTSRSSGILFFGPPGCGKSRLAQAIAGELDQEVRLLSPSDLRGAYLGWGQILIREQFDWVAEKERRMLVIDELDAVARTRRDGEMHSDEKASVNELLVQLDRVGRLGRLVVGTTNFVSSLDEAVIRSGRFGRFVPVPPPTVEEAAAILNYYLNRLCKEDTRAIQPKVFAPSAKVLVEILKLHYEKNVKEGSFFCGADLEQTVNDAYYSRLKKTDIPKGADLSMLKVTITGQDLAEALDSVPKSVSDESVKEFLEDVGRYCGISLERRISEAIFHDQVTHS